MAIFYPSKSGDAMGTPGFQKFNKAQRNEFAAQKRIEEERSINQDYYKVKRLASKFEETIRRQRIAAGLE